MVPDAANALTFTVSGAGALIGLDNGNPADHTSMKSPQRNAFNGLALGVVQSKRSVPGDIRVEVSSPGLKSASVVVTARPASSMTATVEGLKK